MSYEIEGKVALVTGGASGIGLRYVKALLRKGIRGVTIADINTDFGNKALEEIKEEFGTDKAIFVETDVSNEKNFEEAFKQYIAKFNNLDILINNAGILNDQIWEKQITINVNGVAHGTILALEHYIQKYRTDKDGEGVIVNIASVTEISVTNFIPMYAATKFAVTGMSISFGDFDHYNRTKVKVLTLCPGFTITPLVTEISGRHLGEPYQKVYEKYVKTFPVQEPEFVAEAMIKIIKHAKTGTVWVAEDNKGPYQFILPERKTFLSNTI